MKYDIAKNEDGPLRKTMRTSDNASSSGIASSKHKDSATKNGDEPTADRYPGLEERLENIEAHVAVRYGVLYFTMCISCTTAHTLLSTIAASIFT